MATLTTGFMLLKLYGGLRWREDYKICFLGYPVCNTFEIRKHIGCIQLELRSTVKANEAVGMDDIS